MFRLTDEQICKLKKVSELRGCSQTDLIRGFIDSLDEESPDTQGDTQNEKAARRAAFFFMQKAENRMHVFYRFVHDL